MYKTITNQTFFEFNLHNSESNDIFNNMCTTLTITDQLSLGNCQEKKITKFKLTGFQANIEVKFERTSVMKVKNIKCYSPNIYW